MSSVAYAPKPLDDLVVGSVHQVELPAGDAVVLALDEPTVAGVTLLVLASYAGWEPSFSVWFPKGCVMLEARRRRVT